MLFSCGFFMFVKNPTRKKGKRRIHFWLGSLWSIASGPFSFVSNRWMSVIVPFAAGSRNQVGAPRRSSVGFWFRVLVQVRSAADALPSWPWRKSPRPARAV